MTIVEKPGAREVTSSTADGPLGQRPGLDGLRAIAVLLVLVHHLMFPGMEPSWAHAGVPYVGVDVFFVISGFLITRLLLDESRATGAIALGRFWARRAIRLLPLAFAVVAIVGVIGALDPSFFFRSGPSVAPWRSVVAALGYHMNVLQMLPGTHHVWALTHTWSLSVEEQFYVVWPVVVAVIVRRRPERAAWLVALVSAVIVVASSIERWVLAEAGHADYVYNSLDSRAGQLCAGALLAAATLLWPKAVARIARLGWVALAVLLVMSVHDVFHQTGSLLYDVVTVLSVVLIAAAAELGPSLGLAHVLRHPALRWIGTRSYALYLVHYPVFLALTREATGLGTASTVAVRIVATVAITELLHRAVEQPAMRLRHRYAIFSATPSPR